MVYENQLLMDLIEKGKKVGFVAIKDILSIIDEDSEDFDELTHILDNEGIDIVRDNLDNLDDDFAGFIGELENDPDFAEFTNEIENDLKTKDIEDLVSTSTTITADDPVKMYLKEIGQIPLLSVTRELELSRTVQEGIFAERALDAVKTGKKKASPEELEQLEIAVAEGQEACDILTESNLRLVVSIAKKFLGR